MDEGMKHVWIYALMMDGYMEGWVNGWTDGYGRMNG